MLSAWQIMLSVLAFELWESFRREVTIRKKPVWVSISFITLRLRDQLPGTNLINVVILVEWMFKIFKIGELFGLLITVGNQCHCYKCNATDWLNWLVSAEFFHVGVSLRFDCDIKAAFIVQVDCHWFISYLSNEAAIFIFSFLNDSRTYDQKPRH